MDDELRSILEAEMRKQGIGTSDLSRMCGVNRSNISSYKTGASMPSVVTADKIAKPLGVGIEHLWPGLIARKRRRTPKRKALSHIRSAEMDCIDSIETASLDHQTNEAFCEFFRCIGCPALADSYMEHVEQ